MSKHDLAELMARLREMEKRLDILEARIRLLEPETTCVRIPYVVPITPTTGTPIIPPPYTTQVQT